MMMMMLSVRVSRVLWRKARPGDSVGRSVPRNQGHGWPFLCDLVFGIVDGMCLDTS